MPRPSTTTSSGYLLALTQAIEKKLQRALASQSQRLNLLQELFAVIALEVDGRARDIIHMRDDDGVSPEEGRIQNQLCFYDVLADHYVRVPDSGKLILDLIVQLWSQSFASNIFALPFHKWVFEVQLENSEVLVRYSSALVHGATNVFWIDIQTNTRRFFSLFQQFPVFPNAFLVGGPADIFVIELTDQLQKLKVEPVLLLYLSQIKAFQGLELRMTTSTRLKACLYSFTSPGGPMYPTRAVRHAAWDALDFLFPVGRYPRHLISLFFRLLYPWYWSSSCLNFILSCAKAILYSILRLIFSKWENVRKP
ncbi:uncharacterized protein LOC122649514 isoform X2 [Telopea speciosissima]|uniref:uncharacterized protein LOC122649514 isoform X2 n=1 Tax=Telopea speciosissima TaxID=54955 RepID=UPI001CC4B828|nr:uncharacterized protein LOC122649514 isoform X2 [Telopea speciosissima]